MINILARGLSLVPNHQAMEKTIPFLIYNQGIATCARSFVLARNCRQSSLTRKRFGLEVGLYRRLVDLHIGSRLVLVLFQVGVQCRTLHIPWRSYITGQSTSPSKSTM